MAGRECDTVEGAIDYAVKLARHRLRGYTFHAHVNGDSWKGYLLALAAVLLGRGTGKPAVLTFHAGPSQEYFPRSSGAWRLAFQLLFKASGHVICNHEPVRELIVGYGVRPDRVHAIPAFSVQYGEPSHAVLPSAVEAFISAHSPVVFSYALLRPEFTMDLLLDAVQDLRHRHPKLGLLLVGPPAVPAEFQDALAARGVTGAVLVAGNLPHAQFLTALARSDVFVRTHLRDGVCSSVMEALTLGIPVVASDDGIRPPSVVTYDPQVPGELEAKLDAVLLDLRAARARIIRPHAEDHLAREVALLIDSAA
jgi:glycosyltransferase involved in cell wall biosynthesis